MSRVDVQRPRSRTRTRTQGGQQQIDHRPQVSMVTKRPATSRRPTENFGPFPFPKHVVAIAGASLAALLLLIVILVLTMSGSETGTIIITSSPTDQVDIYLDGTLITQKTPHTQSDIQIGEHKLEAKSAGYKPKAYLFKLAAEKPAVIPISLEIDPDYDGPRVGPAGTGPAMLTIVTEPPGASIRIGGLPQGTTPVAIEVEDPKKTVIIEISKSGYKDESKGVSFAVEELAARKKTFRHTLTIDPNAPAAGRASIRVESVPSRATVRLDNTKLDGVTPMVISDLDASRRYSLAVNKTGYGLWTRTIAFNGKLEVEVLAELQKPIGVAPPKNGKNHKGAKKGGKKGKKEKPKKDKRRGGKCGGSGAKLSVMAIGAKSCKVTVGKKSLGDAPFFKKSAPVGKCPIKLSCSEGKRYTTVMELTNGGSEKLIVKDTMWK